MSEGTGGPIDNGRHIPSPEHEARPAPNPFEAREDAHDAVEEAVRLGELEQNPMPSVHAGAEGDSRRLFENVLGEESEEVDVAALQDLFASIEQSKATNTPLTEDQATKLVNLLHLKGSSREEAQGVLEDGGATPDQIARLTQGFQPFEETNLGGKSEEELAALQMQEKGEIENAIAQAELLSQKVLDETDLDPVRSPHLNERLHNAQHRFQHYVEHKKHQLEHYFKVPPKEWFKRGLKYTTVGVTALLLLFIWEMQLIGKMSKKK